MLEEYLEYTIDAGHVLAHHRGTSMAPWYSDLGLSSALPQAAITSEQFLS